MTKTVNDVYQKFKYWPAAKKASTKKCVESFKNKNHNNTNYGCQSLCKMRDNKDVNNRRMFYSNATKLDGFDLCCLCVFFELRAVTTNLSAEYLFKIFEYI